MESNNIVRFKRLSKLAVLPKKATEGSAAYDLVVPRTINVEFTERRKAIPLEFAMALPKGYEAKIEPRSGMSLKGLAAYVAGFRAHVDADVMVGKIDSDYRGCVNVLLKHNMQHGFTIASGTRIAQMTIYKTEDVNFVECEELDETERGEGGLGHSGDI